MVPPGTTGVITYIAPEGAYTIEEEIAGIEVDGKKQKLTMI